MQLKIRKCIDVQNRSSKERVNGFTLIELLFVLIIMSIMTTSIYYSIKVGVAALRADQAQRLVDKVKIALDNFSYAYDRYPCPTPWNRLPSDANYGKEECTNLSQHKQLKVGGVGLVSYGYLPKYVNIGGQWVVLSNYLKDSDLIQMNFNDPWGRRLNYAVTNTMMTSITNNDGKISLVDENDLPTGGVTGNAHYMFLSEGARVGRYAVQNINCSPTCPDAKFVIPNRDQVRAGDTIADTDNYIGYGLYKSNSYWRGVAGKSSIVPDSRFNNGRVAIQKNQADPINTNDKLDVGGIIYAEDNVHALRFCDKGTSDCLAVDSILFKNYSDTDMTPAVKCATTNTYMTAITINAAGRLTPVCNSLVFQPPTVTQLCANWKLSGIYTDGTYQCVQ